MNRASQLEPDEFEREPQSEGRSFSEPEGPIRSVPLIVASWALVIVAVVGVAGFVSMIQFLTPRSMEISEIERMQINMTAKTLIGMPPGEVQSLKQMKQFAKGPLEQRYAHVVLINEISSPEKAMKQLLLVDDAVKQENDRRRKLNLAENFPTESQIELRRIVGDLLQQYQSGDYDTTDLEPSEKALLSSKLGWVGELALTPKKSPAKDHRKKLKQAGTRAFLFAAFAMFIAVVALLGSFAAIIGLVALAMARKISVRLPNRTAHSFVYIETFAIWIVLFFGMQIGAGFIAAMSGRESLAMALGPIAFFGSLISLAWPVYRGIPFATVRQDIGWETDSWFAELFVGGFSYLALIVPMLFGLALTILLTIGISFVSGAGEFESAGPIGHPIAEEIASGNVVVWVLVFISACVAAPIVEETMFRGVLYRYLRDATSSNNARWISVAMSSIISGLIFAMIHPQGLVGIPVLTTLAIGFCLVREWRNSLIGPMVMHAINNTIVTSLLLVSMLT